MNTITTLYNCLTSLHATGIVEKRKRTELLKDLLTRPEVKKSLSETDSRFSWSALLEDIFKLITDISANTDSVNSRTILLNCNGILKTVFNFVCRTNVPLNVKTILVDITKALHDQARYHLNYQTCLEIMNDNILASARVTGQIKAKQWQDLLNTVKHCLTSSNRYTLNELVLVLEISAKIYDKCVIFHLPSHADVVKTTWVKYTDDCQETSTLKSLLKMINAYTRRLACDFRTCMCELGEMFVPSVIRLFDKLNYVDVLVKNEAYTFLLTQMTLHHPCGVIEGDAVFYAHDSAMWRRNVTQMYMMLCRDIPNVSMSHEYLAKDVYLTLFACVLRQIIHGQTASARESRFDESLEPTVKRQCRECVYEKVVERFNEEVWLAIFEKYLTKFGEVVSSDEFTYLLKSLANISDNQITAKQMATHCFIRLLDIDVVKQFASVENNELWSLVWDATVKNEKNKQLSPISNVLLQNLIKHNKPTNIRALLKSFEQDIRTVHRLQTINELLKYRKYNQKSHMIDDETSIFSFKLKLLQILLDMTGSFQLPVSLGMHDIDYNIYCGTPILYHLLIGLNFKDFPLLNNDQIREMERKENDRDGRSLESQFRFYGEDGFFRELSRMEHCFFANHFDESRIPTISITQRLRDIHASDNANAYRSIQNVDAQLFKSKIDNAIVHHFRDSLFNNHRHLLQIDAYLRDRARLHSLILRVAYITQIVSYALDCQLIEDDSNVASIRETIVELTREMDELFLTLYAQAEYDNDHGKIAQLIRMYKKILDVRLHDGVQWFLRKTISKTVIEKVLNVTRVVSGQMDALKWSNSDDYFNVNSPSNRAIFASNECMIQYVKTNTLSRRQTTVLDSLLRQNVDVDNELKVKTIITIMEMMSTYADCWTPEHKTVTVQALKTAISHYQSDTEVSIQILRLIKKCYKLHAQSSDERSEFLSIFHEMFNRVKRYQCDVGVIEEVLSVIDYIIGIDPPEHIIDNELGEILLFLCDNYFESVRLSLAVPFVTIFRMDQLSFQEIMQYIGKMIVKLDDAFELDVKFQVAGSTEYVKLTRDVTFLHLMYKSLSAVETLRPIALFFILKNAVDQKIPPDKIQRTFELIVNDNHLRNVDAYLEDNLEYSLKKWLGKTKSNTYGNISNVPMHLIRCQDIRELFLRYKHVIIYYFIVSGKCDQIRDIFRNDVKTVLKDGVAIHLILQYIISMGRSPTDAKLIEDFLCSVFTSDEVRELFDVNLFETHVALLQHVYDREHFQVRFGGLNINDNVWACFCVTKILTIDCASKNRMLAKFQQTHNLSSPLDRVLTKRPEKFEQITRDFYTNAMLHPGKIQITLYHYSLFIELILNEIDKPEIQPFVAYILENTTFSLLNLLKSNQQSLFNMTIIILRNLFERTLVRHHAVYLRFISRFLASVIQLIGVLRSNGVVASLTALVEYLIVDNKQLHESMLVFDPLPDDDDRFDGIRKLFERDESICVKPGTTRLEKEMTLFLNVDQSETNRLYGLKNLHRLFTIHKDHLAKMFEQLKHQRGSSDDCEENILHKIVRKLIALTKSRDDDVRVTAGKCLGEIGPRDLNTFILLVNDSTTFYDSCNTYNANQIVAWFTMLQLTEFIFDIDPEMRARANEALWAISATSDGLFAIKLNQLTYKGRGLNADLLTPFFQSENDYVQPLAVQTNARVMQALMVANWWPCQPDREWLGNLCALILDAFESPGYLRVLIPVCRKSLAFAELIFPFVVELLICAYCDDVARCLGYFFGMCWKGEGITPSHTRLIEVMLNVASLNRFRSTRTNRIKSLNLNYLHIAKAAQICSKHFATIYYAELWCRASHARLDDTRATILEKISRHSEYGRVVQELLLNAYTEIGDVDALDGCGLLHHLDDDLRAKHYKDREPDGYFVYKDWCLAAGKRAEVATQPGPSQRDMSLYFSPQTKPIRSVGSLAVKLPRVDCVDACWKRELIDGFKLYGLSYSPNVLADKDTDYECLWRLGQWNFVDFDAESGQDNFHKQQYFAMKSLHAHNLSKFHDYVTNARRLVIDTHINANNLEITRKFYTPLAQLTLVQELDDFYDYACRDQHDLSYLKHRWDSLLQTKCVDFARLLEPIIAQRISLLGIHLASDRASDAQDVRDFLQYTHIELAALARRNNSLHIAERSLWALRSMVCADTTKWRVQFEHAQIQWKKRDDKTTARYLMVNLLEECGQRGEMRANALLWFGQSMMEIRQGNPQQYFTECIEITEQLLGQNEIVLNFNTQTNLINDAYVALARYADNEYKQRKNYFESSAFTRKLTYMSKMKEVFKREMSHTDSMTKEQRAILGQTRRSLGHESEQIDRMRAEHDNFMIMAVKYYLRALQHTNKYNLRLFRVVSIWLDNKTNVGLLQLLGDVLPNIPTYKFVSLIPQLSPHMSDNANDDSAQLINRIIVKCCYDHPHHTLPAIFALYNVHKDLPKDERPAEESRTKQAKTILKTFYQCPKLKTLVSAMNNVYGALIELANETMPDRTAIGLSHPLTETHALSHIRDVEIMQVPTVGLELRADAKYDRLVGIHKWNGCFTLVGGINAPKKIACIGSDGRAYLQLVKGKDDLRQDAVMQQVFTIMNNLLADKCENRELLIRTYKIVPLSKRSGILEWCSNTLPLGHYLTNQPQSTGAHEKYYPNDLRPNVARQMLIDARLLPTSERINVYLTICRQLRPAFHHFFLDKFPNTTIWWDRRRTYTKSVAVSSMTGYILGLGDRHVMNILLDETTAELIHIDFGIAFEQGLLLPTPETVPFRLSRDIIDGIGIAGVEGLFRRTCEKTLTVMRENTEIILTILQVLLYDPLHQWQLSSTKALELQQRENASASFSASPDDDVNLKADTVLLQLSNKLEGTENGSPIGVSGQVARLIEEARDPTNLALLFSGWQAYL